MGAQLFRGSLSPRNAKRVFPAELCRKTAPDNVDLEANLICPPRAPSTQEEHARSQINGGHYAG